MLKYLYLIVFIFVATGITYKPLLPWTQQKHQYMVEAVREHSNDLKPFEYPIQDVSEVLSQFPDGKVPIFSYGSLLNELSAKKTISHKTYQTYRPAIAFGVIKVFDRNVPATKHWGRSRRATDTAMLNLFYTDDYQDITNGVLLYADQKNFERLLKREHGYDLKPVSVVLWEDAVELEKKPKVISAYAFIAAEEMREGKVYISRSINPVPGYFKATKKGVKRYGDDFLMVWMMTTLLADRETPLIDWEYNKNLDMSKED